MRKAYEQRNYVVDSEDSENEEMMEYDDYHESYFEDLMKSLQKGYFVLIILSIII